MKKDKSTGLFLFFLRYLITFCISMILVVFILLFAFNAGLQSGAILEASYAEQKLQKLKTEVEKTGEFDVNKIPFTCSYVLLDKKENIIEGNMKKSDVEEVKKIHSGDGQTIRNRYFRIETKDKDWYILYDIKAHFASPVLHNLVPTPEILLIVLFFVCFIVLTIVTAMRFGKKLKLQLEPLIAATNAIKEQQLTFQTTSTKVKEFNQVLTSIDDMKSALKLSLEKQWNEEQNRRMQMAALTHDIKTPLTLVKGNAELLLESELETEPEELASTIYRGAKKMEQYLALLMDAATTETLHLVVKEQFSLETLISEISQQAKALCVAKQLSFAMDTAELTGTFCGDKTLIFRGVVNILDNAVEYAPVNGRISLSVRQDGEMLEFKITDNGPGFSAASMKQATMQFYTEQKGRMGKHFGLGLFIAKSVAEKHGGDLILSNQDAGGGAVVTFTIQSFLSNQI